MLLEPATAFNKVDAIILISSLERWIGIKKFRLVSLAFGSENFFFLLLFMSSLGSSSSLCAAGFFLGFFFFSVQFSVHFSSPSSVFAMLPMFYF